MNFMQKNNEGNNNIVFESQPHEMTGREKYFNKKMKT